MVKKILFITWDGPQTFYMEGLFMPIFKEVMKYCDVEFHVMQFTWGKNERTKITADIAKNLNIHYTSVSILRRPTVALGSIYTLLNGSKKIQKYIDRHKIDIVMPRSTFPAFMVNNINISKVQVIFDADGLPIEEKVEFEGLKKNGFVYNFMKSIEKKILYNSDVVITRSYKAIDILINEFGDKLKNKFTVVNNGRNINDFKYTLSYRESIRKKYSIPENSILLIYVGSLGEKYALKEMNEIFERVKMLKEAYFLILTGDEQYVNKIIPNYSDKQVIVIKANSADVPKYICAADIGFALIYPTHSMKAAVPTKLGEYLLCGLPVIASANIGDTEYILKDFKNCFIYDHNENFKKQLFEIADFIVKHKDKDKDKDREKTRSIAIEHFSLETSAKMYYSAIKKVL